MPIDLQHEYNCFNILCRTVVTCVVFYDYEKAKKYESTKDPILIDDMREYDFKGNIFECYDSYSKKEEFYKVDKDKDFVYTEQLKKKFENKSIIEV